MSTAPISITYKVPIRRHPVVQFTVTYPLGAAGFVLIVAMFIAGLFAHIVAPYDPLELNFGAMLAPPSREHWMGTDAFGRDVFSRIIYGARTALAVGFLASLFVSGLGAVVGVVSAYFGGRIDMLIQRFMDILLSFPIIVLALTVVAVLCKVPVGGLGLAIAGPDERTVLLEEFRVPITVARRVGIRRGDAHAP